MKKSLLIALVLLIANAASAQKKVNIDNLYFEFENITNLSDIKDSLLIEVDLSKLKYQERENDDYNIYIDIPFYVNKHISEKNDFVFVAFNGPAWSVLKSNKQGIVKEYVKIQNEKGEVIGIRQMNKNLTEPISQPGIYYIRLLFKQKPLAKRLAYFYLARLEKKQ